MTNDEQLLTSRKEKLLTWLNVRWRRGRLLRSITNALANSLVFVSILSSFFASIVATGKFESIHPSSLLAVVIAGLPGVCLTILRQFPFQQWAKFQNLRYVVYREIYLRLDNGLIELKEAVDLIVKGGKEISSTAVGLPFLELHATSDDGKA